MERDEAKAILELCRPGNAEDLKDPMIAEAIELMESDTELKAWFNEQQLIDDRIGDCYCELEPPAELKTSILVGMRAHAQNTEEAVKELEEPVPFTTPSGSTSQSWWRNPWIGVAAVFALLFFITAVPRGGQDTQLANIDTAALQADVPAMIQFLAGEIDAVTSRKRSFAKKSSQPAALQAYLASAGSPSPATLPAPVEDSRSLGCFTLDFDGVKMSMICFKEGKLVHLTTVCITDCGDLFSEEPAIYEIRDQAFKAWVEGDQVQIISVKGSKEELSKFI
ncbi:MAG: hypothetical protein AAF065_09130 [Verrucomicrobiota bacterium]